jgi:predicted metal-dependent phosphoesterase TrpH
VSVRYRFRVHEIEHYGDLDAAVSLLVQAGGLNVTSDGVEEGDESAVLAFDAASRDEARAVKARYEELGGIA